PPMTMAVSASALVSARCPPESITALASPGGAAVVIALATWAGVMPAVMLIFVPLVVKVPPLAILPGSTLVPVGLAAASANTAAPVPVIFAFCGGTASGFAIKPAGSRSSEPGTLTSCAGVSG